MHHHFRFPVFGLFFLFRQMHYLNRRHSTAPAKPNHRSDRQITHDYARSMQRAGYRTRRSGFWQRVAARRARLWD